MHIAPVLFKKIYHGCGVVCAKIACRNTEFRSPSLTDDKEKGKKRKKEEKEEGEQAKINDKFYYFSFDPFIAFRYYIVRLTGFFRGDMQLEKI